MNDSYRDQFEAWFASSRRNRGVRKRPDFARRPDDTYHDDHTQRHWWTWQNARAAIAIATAKDEPLPEAK